MLGNQLFEILKLATMRYTKDRSIFEELTIILQRISMHDNIKMKELCTPDYVEFLNTQMLKCKDSRSTDSEELLAFNNLSQVLKNI